MPVAVAWLRRNLRLDDNRVLDAALRAADAVVPVFVVDDHDPTEDVSPPRLAFLSESLEALAAALRGKGGRLVVRGGPSGPALAALCRETGAGAVFAHADHEPHGKALLTEARRHLLEQGSLAERRRGPFRPSPGRTRDAGGTAVHGLHAVLAPLARVGQACAGRRTRARARPGRRALRCVSLDPAREAGCVKELAWREFYAGILDAFPRVLTESFRKEVDAFPWVSGDEAERRFAAWAAGKTGYPIVDAGMRQLRAEGWMHNRVRMIVASFLAKDLLVDWRRGETFFRRHLADGDPASNNGGWQWAAGSGTDAQPFFRIFNPVLQGRKFDPDAAYVKRWVPELAHVDAAPADLHAPWTLDMPPADYAVPIVDHAEARRAALAAFAALRTR